ncbi:hypothetical protein [Streptomyces hebeiensis]
MPCGAPDRWCGQSSPTITPARIERLGEGGCFVASDAGLTAEERGEAVLVGLDRLYGGE